jgi:hypothetical protein
MLRSSLRLHSAGSRTQEGIGFQRFVNIVALSQIPGGYCSELLESWQSSDIKTLPVWPNRDKGCKSLCLGSLEI